MSMDIVMIVIATVVAFLIGLSAGLFIWWCRAKSLSNMKDDTYSSVVRGNKLRWFNSTFNSGKNAKVSMETINTNTLRSNKRVFDDSFDTSDASNSHAIEMQDLSLLSPFDIESVVDLSVQRQTEKVTTFPHVTENTKFAAAKDGKSIVISIDPNSQKETPDVIHSTKFDDKLITKVTINDPLDVTGGSANISELDLSQECTIIHQTDEMCAISLAPVEARNKIAESSDPHKPKLLCALTKKQSPKDLKEFSDGLDYSKKGIQSLPKYSTLRDSYFKSYPKPSQVAIKMQSLESIPEALPLASVSLNNSTLMHSTPLAKRKSSGLLGSSYFSFISLINPTKSKNSKSDVENST